SPPQFDDNEDTILTFAEMFNFLHGEMEDLDIDKAMEVDSATEYMQSMFAQVFTSRPAEQLEEGKCHYPQLDAAELDVLLRLFIQDRKVGRADPRKWKGGLYDITKAIYKSRRSLIDIVEHRITTAQVTGQSLTNMWVIRAATTASENVDQDVDMTEDTTSSFRFHRATYSPEDIEELRHLCETAYGFLTQLRKPTNKETKIIKGLVEGTILCSRLPDFLKRICSNEALRKIQNTIHAQVEGDLLIKLQPEFPVYPDFQTKVRLIGNITMGLENGRHDKQKVIELLQNAKQIYYDRKVHAVHIIFWTREMAAKWSHEVKTLPFRNRTFPLINEHPDDTYTSSPGTVNSAEVWKRQVLDSTENGQEPVTLVEHSPAEENRINYSLKSQQMDKVQRLIMKQVTSKRVRCSSENLDRITNLDISKLPVGKGKGGLILKQYGLKEVQALPYGNCQYYSIAMALLNRECNQPGEAKILETLTSKLKKGIAAAANHFFAEEFPHRSRMQMLEVQNDEKVKLTPSQSAEALQHHFKDISGSKSHPDSCIDRRNWGSTTTLRMLAKILHRNIYVVEASSGMGTANFSLFTAGERVCNGMEFMTAKERIFTLSEITDWIKLLKDECTEKASTEGPPLVITFRSNHYNWLRFAVEEKSSTSVSINTTNNTPDNAMDFDEDFMMEDTEEATDVQTKVATQAELPPKETQPVIIQQTIPPAQSTGTKLRSLAEQEEFDEIERFGGARKEELTVFPTTGINALIPAYRQPLRDVDMSDDAEVLQWCLQYEISKDVLGEWQRELRSRESQETYTPSSSTPTPQSDSQCSAEGVEQHGVGRFKGDTDIPTGIRQQMKQLRSQ
ncbi:hypothetical protein PF006_g26128, partial [Phytophthora fragariae]